MSDYSLYLTDTKGQPTGEAGGALEGKAEEIRSWSPQTPPKKHTQ